MRVKRRRLAEISDGHDDVSMLSGDEGEEREKKREIEWWDVRGEAAYNLSRIYIHSGLHELAEQIVKDFLTIG